MVQLAPHDGRADQCVCPMCAPYSKVENYTYVLNEIAKRVGAVYLEVKIVMLIYTDIWKCPEGIKLSPSLMVIEAVWYKSGWDGLRRCGTPNGWFTDQKMSGGGPIVDIGVHAIDGAWYLMGTPKPVRVSATTYSNIGAREAKGMSTYIGTPSPDNKNDCEDIGAGVIYFANGAQLFFEASWTVNLPDRREVFISGTKAGAMHTPPTIYKNVEG